MQAWTFEKFGGKEVLKISTEPTPSVASKEDVVIKITHTSVNPVDWKIREGYLQELLPHEFPIIPGWDVAGVIEAKGDNVNQFEVGDNVYAYARNPLIKNGTYAEYIALPQSSLSLIPENISLMEAAALPLTSLTAYQALTQRLQIKKGETLLITAGAGGVGSMAIQFAKYFGAVVVTTASSRNHPYVKGLGADHIIDYNKDDVSAKVLEFFPTGVDTVLDAVGSSALDDSWKVIKEGGRLVSIVSEPDPNLASKKEVQASFHFVEPNGRQLTEIGQLIHSKAVLPPSLTTKSIREAPQALEESKGGHTKGKVVLEIDF